MHGQQNIKLEFILFTARLLAIQSTTFHVAVEYAFRFAAFGPAIKRTPCIIYIYIYIVYIKSVTITGYSYWIPRDYFGRNWLPTSTV